MENIDDKPNPPEQRNTVYYTSVLKTSVPYELSDLSSILVLDFSWTAIVYVIYLLIDNQGSALTTLKSVYSKI